MKIQAQTNQQSTSTPRSTRLREPEFPFQRLQGIAYDGFEPIHKVKQRRKLPSGKKLLIDSSVWLAAGTRQWSNWFQRLLVYAPRKQWTILLDSAVYADLYQLMESPSHQEAAARALKLIDDFRKELTPLELFKEIPPMSGESIIIPWEHAMRILQQEDNSILITKSMCIPDIELEATEAPHRIHYAENYVPLIR